MMRTPMLVILSLSVALLFNLDASNLDASAQGTIKPTERFCLQTSDPQGAEGPLCRFETREQCIASKTAPSDFCYANPAGGRG